MFEARLSQAVLLKKVLDAVRDLVSDANFDCNDSGLALQAMDDSHVSLVSLLLKAEGFDPYRCDRNMALGINLSSLSKVLRCAGNEDLLTLKAEENPEVLNLTFESSTADRIQEYAIKLMDIDQEHMGIPDAEYDAIVTMPSSEFQRIVRDLLGISESVKIQMNKDSVTFSCEGDIGNGSITIKQSSSAEDDTATTINLTQPVRHTLSLKYLSNFTKATPLSTQVSLSMSPGFPLLVEYKMEGGHLRFYLAPKIDDNEENGAAAADEDDYEGGDAKVDDDE